MNECDGKQNKELNKYRKKFEKKEYLIWKPESE